ncbi:MAG: hypothetical protein ACYC6M_11440 [Terriglobales bacterium]
MKVMYRALRNLAKKWTAVQGWKEALSRFALLWETRFPRHSAGIRLHPFTQKN